MGQLFEVEGMMLGAAFLTFLYLLFRAIKENSRPLFLASGGWLFLLLHVFLRIYERQSLAEAFLYFFALGISLYVVLLVQELYPEQERLFALYLLTPISHIVYRFLGELNYPLPIGIGGIASDSGIMLLITGYISYRSFERPIVSFSVIPMAVVFLAYKALQGTLVGLILMTLGAIIFSWATIRVTREGIFKGGFVPEVDFRGLVLLDYSRLDSFLSKYSDSPVLFITRSTSKASDNWSVFHVSTVPVENSISPTSLERMRHIIVQYLREAKNSGARGLVVIDCLDFLLLYNDRLAVLRFLGDVRDHAIINDGVVFVAVSESIDEHTRKLLEKLSDGRV